MKNILLCGKMGSGKDTVANILRDDYGYKSVAIGDTIKIITHSLQRATLMYAATKYIAQLSVALLGEKNINFMADIREVSNYLLSIGATRNKGLLRHAYQQIGTECVRKYVPDIWIRLAQQRARTLNKKGYPVVISDVRMEDEYWMFVNAGYSPFEVFAPMHIRVERLVKRDRDFNPESLKHMTEMIRFNCPVIRNDGSLDDLKRKMALIFEPALVSGG